MVTRAVACRRRGDTAGPFRDCAFGIACALRTHGGQVFTQPVNLVRLGTGYCLAHPKDEAYAD